MKVLFVAGFGPIVRDLDASIDLYQNVMGLPFKREGDYLHTDQVEGVKAFALWKLEEAAQSTFGTDTWPEDIEIPQAWLEFDVEDVAGATEELQAKGYRVLVAVREEPWGQTVSRMISPEGLLVGVTETPWMRGG